MKRTRSAPGERPQASPDGNALFVVLPALWAAGVVALTFVLPGRIHVVQLLAAAPAIACAGSGRRRCVLAGGACALVALVPLSGGVRFEAEMGHVLAIFAVIAASYLMTGRRARLDRELARVREVALAAQRVLLRPLPRRAGGVRLAGDYLSASRGALIGGDLYEVLETPFGVRVILGDVRGHGLPAVGAVAALLGCFREAGHDEADLSGVLRRLDRALARHLCERARGEHLAPAGEPQAPSTEEFATVLLLELGPDGELAMLNCGHPWPYRIDHAAGVGCRPEPLTDTDPLPPLGVLDADAVRGTVFRTELLPGQGLFLHTDGAAEARDADGVFFPLGDALAAAARRAVAAGVLDPDTVVRAVRTALLDHVAGRLADDVALLALTRPPAPLPPRRDPLPPDRSTAEPQLDVT